MFKRLCFISALALASLSAATVTQVYSRAALGADDLIDWSQFGPSGTIVNIGAHGVTTNGIGFTLTSFNHSTNSADVGAAYEIRTMGVDWNTGPFTPGTVVLHHLYDDDGFHGPFRYNIISFDAKVAGVGTYIGVNFSDKTPYWADGFGHAFDGKHVDASVINVDEQLHILPIPYFAMLSDTADMDFIYNSGLVAPAADHGSVIMNVDVRDFAPAVPEPASMAALGLGVAAMLRRQKRWNARAKSPCVGTAPPQLLL